MINKICHNCFCLFNYGPKKGWLNCSCGVYKMEKEIINLEDYLSSSGKYPERLNSDELTKSVKDNAIVLLNKVNQLLQELKIFDVKVSSGFRPSAVNAKVKGAAKKSLHMSGRAVDIQDPENKIAHKILANPDILKKYDLWMEDPSVTSNWCHLDNGTRTERALRIFKP